MEGNREIRSGGFPSLPLDGPGCTEVKKPKKPPGRATISWEALLMAPSGGISSLLTPGRKVERRYCMNPGSMRMHIIPFNKIQFSAVVKKNHALPSKPGTKITCLRCSTFNRRRLGCRSYWISVLRNPLRLKAGVKRIYRR